MKMRSNRLAHFRRLLKGHGLDAAVVSTKSNRYYLSGFTGTAALLYIDQEKAVLLTDFRYIEQATEQAKDFTIVKYDRDIYGEIVSLLGRQSNVRIGFEEEDTYKRYRLLSQVFKDQKVELVAIDHILADIRRVKNDEEIKAIKSAAAIGDKGFQFVLDFIKPGVTERQIAVELECFMKKEGAQDVSFETIIASGERSSLPHGVASDRILHVGDLVVMDFGCIYDYYCSDMTRTIGIGPLSEKQQEIYGIVKDAQQKALEAVRAGVMASTLDEIAREQIQEAGYGKAFGHALGHSVGLEIHEAPSISGTDRTILTPNMIITIEPGIYLDGQFGVRIEDLVCVKNQGYELMNHATKELQIIHF
ncbi:aminopeptidase P family protein [Clostridia bacterium]|nr:aminopeptidase P family protein [Clostridia bacterium]